MGKGSCLCGEFAYEFEGEPAANIACHCLPCRKTSSTSCSYNILVSDDKFRLISGKAKNYTRKGVSGKDVTYNMCDNCGNLVFVEAAAMAGLKIIKMGTVDDANLVDNLGYPGMEIFTKDRLPWARPLPGAEQKEVS